MHIKDCALAMRFNPDIRVFAARLKATGKPVKVVMSACMRKLLTIINAMLKANAQRKPKNHLTFKTVARRFSHVFD